MLINPSVTTTAVDLSRLPAPAVVETLSYQQIFDEMLADLQARDAGFTALVPSDPAWAILEVAAYREMLIRQRVNDAAKDTMVAFARGADLDHRGALVNVARLVITPADPDSGTPAVLEDDEAYRRRIILGPDGFSVAGPEAAYVFHALSAHPEVLDATAVSPEPGEVLVTVQSRVGDGEAAAPVLAAVAAALNAETVRPLTDLVSVASAEVIPFTVEAQLVFFAGPDSGVVLAAAIARLDAFLAENRRLGRDVPRSALFAALHITGVQKVILTQPAADLVVTRGQVAVCSARAVTAGGLGE